MPELPEVETIVRGLRKNLLNKQVVAVKLFYKPLIVSTNKSFSVNKLTGDTFCAIERHGKYIKLTSKKNVRVVIHLRMTGQLFMADDNYNVDKHVHLDIALQDGTRLIYRDIRKFGRWTVVGSGASFEDFINAGTDALAIGKPELTALISKYKAKKLKAFLLDQTLLAGIGNIYADEICWGLGFDPEVSVGKVSVDKLHAEILTVLKLAIKNKGTSVSDYITSTAAKGNFQNLLNVYKQSICKKCGSLVIRKKVAGRTSHVCQLCQKLTK